MAMVGGGGPPLRTGRNSPANSGTPSPIGSPHPRLGPISANPQLLTNLRIRTGSTLSPLSRMSSVSERRDSTSSAVSHESEVVSFLDEENIDEGQSTDRLDRVDPTAMGNYFAMDIMDNFEPSSLDLLKAEWDKHGGTVTVTQFGIILADMMKANIHDKMFAARVYALFHDLSGSDTLGFQTFCNFLMECGSVGYGTSTLYSDYETYIPEYTSRPIEHDKFLDIDRIKYFPELNKWMVFEKQNSKARLCDLEDTTFRVTKEMKSHTGMIMNADYIHSLGCLLTSGEDRKMILWDMSKTSSYSAHAIRARVTTSSPQLSLCWWSRYNSLFTGGTDGKVEMWDGNLRHQQTMVYHKDIVMDLLSIPVMDFLASASMDRVICLWDGETRQPTRLLNGHTKGIVSISYSPEYRSILSGGFDRKLLLWNLFGDNKPIRLNETSLGSAHKAPIVGVRVVPNSPEMVTVDRLGCLKTWDIRTLNCIQTVDAQPLQSGEFHVTMEYDPTRHSFIVAGKGIKQLFEPMKSTEDPYITDSLPVITTVYSYADDTFAVICGTKVKVWDARTGKYSRTFRNLSESELTALTLHMSGQMFVIGNHIGEIKVFTYAKGAFRRKLHSHQKEVTNLFFLDKDKLASSSWDNTVKIQDFDTGVPLKVINAHELDITVVTQTLNADLLATGAADKEVRMWERTTLLHVTTIFASAEVTSVAFLDPMPLVAIADARGEIQIWTTRVDSFPFAEVLRFNNTSEGFSDNYPALALGIVTRGRAHYLYSGDDRGVVRLFELKNLISMLFGKKVVETPAHLTSTGSSRKIVFDSSRSGRDSPTQRLTEFKNKLERLKSVDHQTFSKDPPTWNTNPSLSTTSKLEEQFVGVTVPEVRHWQAHSDGIRCMYAIQGSATLVTSAYDLIVCLWDLDGNQIGTLCQGSCKSWAFSLPSLGAKSKDMKVDLKAKAVEVRLGLEKEEVVHLADTLLEDEEPQYVRRYPEKDSTYALNALYKSHLAHDPGHIPANLRRSPSPVRFIREHNRKQKEIKLGGTKYKGRGLASAAKRLDSALSSSEEHRVDPNLPYVATDIANRTLKKGASGAVADAVCHPLDTINLRLKVQIQPPYKYTGVVQAARIITREEGVRGLYRGLGTTIIGGVPSSAVCFLVYEWAKRHGQDNNVADPIIHLSAGALGQLASSVIYQPFEVVRARFQLPSVTSTSSGFLRTSYQYRNTFHALRKIGKYEGFGGLYAGYGATLLLDCCFAAVQFAIWEEMKLLFHWKKTLEIGEPDTDISTFDHFVAGGVSGAIAALVTNPLDVVSCRLMTQGDLGRYGGVKKTLQTIVAEEGAAGLMKGSVPRMLSVAPLAAIAFTLYEQTRKYVFREGALQKGLGMIFGSG